MDPENTQYLLRAQMSRSGHILINQSIEQSKQTIRISFKSTSNRLFVIIWAIQMFVMYGNPTKLDRCTNTSYKNLCTVKIITGPKRNSAPSSSNFCNIASFSTTKMYLAVE